MGFAPALRGTGSGATFLQPLALHLRDLTLDLSEGGYTRTTLAMLNRDLRRAVRSTLGCTVRLDVATPAGTSPIEVNVVDRTIEPREIAAVLQLPLGSLVPDTGGSITFYASETGAFDEMRTELAATGITQDELDQQGLLPSAAIAPVVTGLHDFSLLNRAVGVLLNRGHNIEQARAELRRRAESSGTDLTTTAQAILSSAHY